MVLQQFLERAFPTNGVSSNKVALHSPLLLENKEGAKKNRLVWIKGNEKKVL
jgi:hypothetical protein